MIPVVYLQCWKKANVDIAANHAARSNVVYLIADRKYADVEFVDIAKWIPDINEWLKFQGNGKVVDFESICMYRWLCVYKLMCDVGLDIVWYCDSDVLVYDNADNQHNMLGNPDMTFSYCQEYRDQGVVNPLGHAGHSIVCKRLVELFINTRHDKWNDMFAWTELISKSRENIIDTAEPSNGIVWDHHLGNNLKHYESYKGIKRVSFVDRKPVVHHKSLGKLSTPVLHCWNDSEDLMPQFASFVDYP